MTRALELAERGRFGVSPNPMVGCVIERDGEVLGEGFHHRAGGPHAEIEALNACSRDPRGATAWITLEPCSHAGRTPPCVNALATAGIARVAIAMQDPFPQVNGKGIESLGAAGIDVVVGAGAREAALLNEKFLHSVRTGRPFVLLKAGMTLDGKLASVSRKPQLITSVESRQKSLELREEYDAILVGSGTVIEDDPRLTRRLNLNSSLTPWRRVVVDSIGRMPVGARVLTDGGPTTVFTRFSESIAPAPNLDVVEVPGKGRIDLDVVLEVLHERGVRSLIAEGGSTLHSELIRKGLWQKMTLFVAPAVLGGSTAPSIFEDEGVLEMAEAPHFRFDRVELLGGDLMITAYPE
ncbi:MAG TPA: bifunctional diaminohydroxyphosphoribosylaminopyrimidine deaminase/5-amino-6-(5-phosphoribosylamino)uracil reductase RibD [Thermoanaerobaculia bacterium]|nr:bifunctional diaminohydroxyphosphoribosylaminopyrimidine deaminase/5-amino-6-(5-phosphoribosylamino)uracil reductase RibD [Thermoanaerobaculia bacterium]